jgi:hypothetical protein
MILKGWEKTWLTKAWNNQFQLVVMEDNIIASFFTVTHDIEKDMEIDEPCIDPIETTLVGM